jgi:hypothetical protein
MERKNINYIIDIIILVGFIIVGITGIFLFPLILDLIGSSIIPVFQFNIIHSWFGLIIGFTMLLHFILHFKTIKKKTDIIRKKPIKNKKKHKNYILNYSIDIILSIFFILIFISGIILFPGFLQLIGINPVFFPTYFFSIIHGWLGIITVGLIIVHIYLNLNWFKARTKSTIKLFKQKPEITKKTFATIGVITIIILTSLTFISAESVTEFLGFSVEGKITISGIGSFDYDSKNIITVRGDIFNEGLFSIFDILVYLDNTNKIDMEYHLDKELNTYVIDSINGENNFWYEAYYDGGWPENNVFRMDHYPVKEKMTIKIFQTSDSEINDYYSIFRNEVSRKKENNGNIIIPEVLIRSPTNNLRLRNVLVTPHNLRNDVFQNGVITAIDVIMSLSDQEKLNYNLKWYDSIGSAEVVRDYWVEAINDDVAHGRCGFVYEAGSEKFNGFRGNHIHIPSDIRVLNSPEYVEWFWICL